MVAFDDEDLKAIRTAVTGRQVVVITEATGATLSNAIVEVLANSSYVSADTESVPKSNIFETKYSRQREWWNTPRKDRRRKHK